MREDRYALVRPCRRRSVRIEPRFVHRAWPRRGLRSLVLARSRGRRSCRSVKPRRAVPACSTTGTSNSCPTSGATTRSTFEASRSLPDGTLRRDRSTSMDRLAGDRLPRTTLARFDLDGINPGGLRSRAFPTTPDSAYTVTFSMSGNGDCAPQNKVVEVEAAGQSAQFTWDIANGNTAQNGDWGTQTWGFTATSTSTNLALISRDPRNAACGVVVGTISVTPG